MELRQLQYFQMVSKLNSITRAAELLHVSQPSVTVAIQKLEEELGVQLLDRGQKQLSLTVEGQVFFVKIEDILNRLEDTVAILQGHSYYLAAGGLMQEAISDRQFTQHNQVHIA